MLLGNYFKYGSHGLTALQGVKMLFLILTVT